VNPAALGSLVAVVFGVGWVWGTLARRARRRRDTWRDWWQGAR